MMIPIDVLATTSSLTWLLVPLSPFFIGALTAVISRKTWVSNLLATTFFSQFAMGSLVLATSNIYEELGFREIHGAYAYAEKIQTIAVMAAVLSALGGLIARGLVRIKRAAA